MKREQNGDGGRLQRNAKSQRLNRLYAVSSAVNNAILRIHDVSQLTREACRIAVEDGGLHMAWVGLAEPGGDHLQPVAWWGGNDHYVQSITISTDPRTPPGNGPAGEAFRAGQAVCCNDIAADPNSASQAEAAQRGYRSCAVFPLKVEQKTIGIFVFYSGQPDFFTADEMSLLGTLAENLSYAMETRQKEQRKQLAEAALQSSQNQLRDIIESVDGIVWEADARTFRFTFVSPQAERMLGYPIARWLEDPAFWADQIHPDDREATVTYCSQCVRENRDHEFEYRMIAADGRAVWLRDLVTVVAANGAPAKLRGIMVDVSERRAAEDRHTRQRDALIRLTGQRPFEGVDVRAALRSITETAARTLGVSRVSIWRYQADHSVIECVDLFELQDQRHSAGTVLAAAAYPTYFRALREVNVIAADDAVTDPRTSEFADNYLRPLGIRSMLDVPIQVGGVLDGVLCHEQVGSARQWTADEKTFAVAMANLVSLALEGWERARAERAVAEKTEILETIFNNAPVMLSFIDATGRVQMANREMERVTGWALQEIQAHPNIFHEWYPDPQYRARVMESICAGKGEFAEFEMRVRSGSLITANFAHVTLSAGSSLGIGMDITDRKGSQRQLAAFATLGRRLGAAATAIDAARVIMDTADDLFGWDACWLHLHDTEQDWSTSILNMDIVDGRRQDVPPAYYTGAPSPGVRRAIEQGSQLILREKSDPHPPDLHPYGDTSRPSASIMIIPVRHGGEIIAVMSIQSYTIHAYRREDLSALEALADYCGGALAQIRAREARREADQRFSELAETVEDVFWISDATEIRHHYISPGYERLWGRSCQSLYENPLSWADAIHPEDRPRAAQAAAAVRERGATYKEEYRLLRPNGEIRWIRDRAFPVRDDKGQIVRIVGVARDVTQEKCAEQELHQREEEFRALIENASDLITVVNARGIIRFQSPSAERILGYPAESMIGHNALELVHPDDIPQATAALSRSMTNPATPVPVDYRVRHQNGTWHTLQSIGRNIPHRAADGFIVINSRDVTDNRKLEEQFRQSQKMEAIGQLAGGVAHDFNNILTVIQGYGSLLMTAKGATQETTDAAHQIIQASERAANLTRQLLAFSRRQVMQSRRLDLNEVVISLAKMLQRIVGEDVRLQLNLHPRPVMTNADSGMLDQVLMNLVVNARDAMPGGGQLVIETAERNFSEADARAIQDARPGRHVCLRVSDTGYGIPAEHLSRIFEPFFTTKEPGKGTGLGLATVFGIVKQHGGSLSVESEVGRGTTFELYLPAVEATVPSHTEETARPKPRGGTETILIVEDEAAVRILTRVVLERHGYKVLEAGDGVEALRVWQQHQGAIQLLLTDIVMPEGVTGRELAMKLQERNPRLRVIFTSGYSADIAGRELTLEEGQNFLQKPCPPDEILATIRRSLDG